MATEYDPVRQAAADADDEIDPDERDAIIARSRELRRQSDEMKARLEAEAAEKTATQKRPRRGAQKKTESDQES